MTSNRKAQSYPELSQYEFVPVDDITGIEKENLLKIKGKYFEIKQIDFVSEVKKALNILNEFVAYSASTD
jgi:hypothetical protein